jgi:hypothetical protein
MWITACAFVAILNGTKYLLISPFNFYAGTEINLKCLYNFSTCRYCDLPFADE